jgi:hypothetical protein
MDEGFIFEVGTEIQYVAYAPTPHRVQTFRYLESIPSTLIQSPRNELVAAATCHVVANAITLAEIESGESSVGDC